MISAAGGRTVSYLWIMAREPQLDPVITADLVGQARALGFATDQLIMVAHPPTGRLSGDISQ